MAQSEEPQKPVIVDEGSSITLGDQIPILEV